ncbi:hypothetical protein MMC20_005740 [Loxospora ochrophaea]|nr:hypothetical protein [Loxospora ochrophaea]
MSTKPSSSMVDPTIFEHLQAKIDEDIQLRDELRHTLQILERQVQPTITEASDSIAAQVTTISQLSAAASKHPYYKYNSLWTRDIQNASFSAILCGWLGGFPDFNNPGAPPTGKLLTIEQVGTILQVPVNLKDRDAFHLTIEEYLQSLISVIEELARLAVNSVTLGDYQRPLQISQFVKDLHAGFQILNLKNDSLRRRSDGIKYNTYPTRCRRHLSLTHSPGSDQISPLSQKTSIANIHQSPQLKKIEDVVYDLSLRNLLPREQQQQQQQQ